MKLKQHSHKKHSALKAKITAAIAKEINDKNRDERIICLAKRLQRLAMRWNLQMNTYHGLDFKTNIPMLSIDVIRSKFN